MESPVSRLLTPLIVLLLLPTLAAPALGDGLDRSLEAIVDAPDADARRAAADAFAASTDASVEDLLAAMRAFGRFQAEDAGAHVEEVVIPGPGGGRIARTVVYVPPTYDPATPAPLLLALHGAGGRGAEVVPTWRAVADALGMVLVAPTEAGANEGYSFSREERDDVFVVLRWARRRFNVDENRIHLTGVSRGGHLTWDLALRHPTTWASIAPMIGGPRLHPAEGQNNVRYAENVAHLSIRDLQGREDDARLVFNLALIFQRRNALHARDAKLLLQSGYGHGFDFAAVDWKAFLASAVRDPHPKRVVRAVANEDEGRSLWVEVLETKSPVKEVFKLQVPQSKWAALGDAGQRRLLQAEADRRTGRLEVHRRGVGRFEARGKGIKRFRLLLPDDAFEPGERVEVVFNGRRKRKKVSPSKQTLLREFAERFDRTFLPVVEVVIP